jgi:DNA-binding CsgD family transcriptional regulator
MLRNTFLTNRQLEIWRHLIKNITQAEIGRLLGITRQAVHYAEEAIIPKVGHALRYTAYTNMLNIQYLDATKGVLLGYSPSSKNKVIVTFSAINGVQTWHYEHPDCGLCEWVDRCKTRLIEEATERDVELSDKVRSLSPSKLALHIFSKIIPELDA